MDITLYSCTAEPNRLDKTSFLTSKKAITGAVPRGDIGCMTPTITIEAADSEVIGANYCYISAWDRYYFITDIHSPVEGLFIISLRTDVLMSFKDSIGLQSGIVEKQQNIYNMYLPGDIPAETRPLVTTEKLTKTSTAEFDNQADTFVLIALGGK